MGRMNIKDALLQLGGSVKLYRTLVTGFRDKYLDVDEEIRDRLKRGDAETGRRLAHSMKGLAGNLGAMDLQIRAKDLETAIKPFVETSMDDKILDDILSIEWKMFSMELSRIRKDIEMILSVSDEELAGVTTSDELRIHREDQGRGADNESGLPVESEDEGPLPADSPEKLMNSNQLSEEMVEALHLLVHALNTYNYTLVKGALERVDNQTMEVCCPDSWSKILVHINEYEYDLAKEEIAKGVLDEE